MYVTGFQLFGWGFDVRLQSRRVLLSLYWQFRTGSAITYGFFGN